MKDYDRLTADEGARIEASFKRHINKGQVAYLRAGRLDVMEADRQGVRFTDPVTGTPFIDCFTSAGCFNVGRHNPEILKALDEALDDLDMGSYNMVSPHKVAATFRVLVPMPQRSIKRQMGSMATTTIDPGGAGISRDIKG